jgi:DNA-binding response OmpR family regulator
MSSVRPRENTVLVVEDDRISRDLLVRALTREGYAVVEAADGAEALAALDEQLVDLVLLDITMPRVSGIEVLHTIRQRYGPDDVPVVMTSARTEVEDVLGALQIGANDYVMKPLNFPITMKRVSAVLTYRQANRERNRALRRLELLVGHTDAAVSVHRADGTFLSASDALQRILGRTSEELRGLRLHDLLHPEDASGLAERPADLPDVYTLVARILRGAAFGWYDITAQAVRDRATGHVEEVQAIWKDLGQRLAVPVAPAREAAPGRGASFAFTPPRPPDRLSALVLTPWSTPTRGDATPLGAQGPPVVVVPGVPDDVRAEILTQLRVRPESVG